MPELMNLCSAFGLSTSAGLNAYIPLLTLSILANRGIVHVAPPYDVIGTWWVMAILIVLLVVELVVDKVPGADHVNDIVHSVIRPASGAILFASQAGLIHDVHPAVWLILGLLCAGAVHTAKAVSRPVVNVASVGFATPVVSALENLVSTTLAIVSILAPVLAAILVAIFAWIAIRLFRKLLRRRNRPIVVTAVPVVSVPIAPAPLLAGDRSA
jgi:hypothetical protein